ncbi:MAG: MFS transporter [Pleomorphochaeta sp.]
MYRNLPKSIYSLAFINFINGFGNFVFPFLTLFLTLKLGYSSADAGYFMMISMAMYVPGSLLTSKIADKVSRKKIMLISQALFSFTFLVCGIIYDYKEIIPYVILLTFFFDGATDPARQALHTDHTNFDNRQESFSLFYLAYNIGFGIGPAIAGLLFNSYPRLLFLIAGGFGLLVTFIIAFTIDDKKPDAQMIEDSIKNNQTDKAVEGNVFKALMARPKLLTYIVITGIFFLCVSIVLFLLPLYSTASFGEKGPTIYGFLMSTNAVTVVIITPFIVKLTHKKNTLTVMVISFILYLLGFNILTITAVAIIFGLGVIVFSVGESVHATNNDYFVANHTPLGHRARFSTIVNIIQGTGYAVGPYISGLLLDTYSYKQVIHIVSAVVLFCVLAMLYLRHTYIRDGETIVPTNETEQAISE